MMLNVEERLRYRRFPVTCVYGPDRMVFAGFTSNLFRFERDPDQSDVIGPPKGAMGTGDRPQKATRLLACRLTIYGQSPLANAMPHDHDHETDQLVDAAVVALTEWAVTGKTSILPLAFTEARFVTNKAEREALYAEGWPGAVYLLRFKIPRGVDALNYVSGELPGTARPQGTVTDTENEIHVRLNAGDTPEIVPV
jgi:hypothetical protein